MKSFVLSSLHLAGACPSAVRMGKAHVFIPRSLLHVSHHIHIPLSTLAEIHPKLDSKPSPLDFLSVVQNLTFTLNPSPDCVLYRIQDARGVQPRFLAISFEVLEGFPNGIAASR
jgi:hypothetical protein